METLSPLACGTCTCRRLTIYLPRGPARAVDRAGLRRTPRLPPDYQCIGEAIQSNDRRRRRQIEPRERSRLVGAPERPK